MDCLLAVQTSLVLLLIINLQPEPCLVLFVLQKWMQAYFPFRSMLRWCPMGSRSPSTDHWPSGLQVSNWAAALKGPANKTPLTLCSFFNHPRNWLHCTECPPHIIKRQTASWDGKLCLWDGVPSWSMENWSVSAEDACCFHEGMRELQRGKQQSCIQSSKRDIFGKSFCKIGHWDIFTPVCWPVFESDAPPALLSCRKCELVQT